MAHIETPKKYYKSCYLVGDKITIAPINSIAPLLPAPELQTGSAEIKYGNVEIKIVTPQETFTTKSAFSPEEILLSISGLYIIRYIGETIYSWDAHGSQGGSRESFIVSYFISAVENRLPFKKWTVTEVLNRLFDLAEPIRRGEKPRFRLEESQAKKFDTILAPEFSFTRQTLRECLQQVGHIVHGEPRITPKKKDGEWYYEVSYDLYGGTRKWMHANRRYIANTLAYTLEQYATQLDTNPENLINKLKHRDGVISDPSAYLFKSVRAEPMYVQITESNMLIATQFPIYTVEKLEFLYEGQSYDITQYLFERSVYNSQLSSYDSQYPYSKAYGLMFTQGEKNITGLNFKQEHPISDVFSSYAIVNIIRQTMGNSNWNPSDFAKLCFRVTYTPYYNARVKQVKTNYTEYDTPAALVYNQSSNLVESRAFGESLKGVIARMGNPEKSRTYMLSRLSQIPKAGMKFDEDYYISAVFTEILPTYIRCTVALTRDFNRISQYIGISSVKRYSQVSEKMAQERNVVYEEYIVFGDFVEQDKDCLIGINLLGQLYKVFRGETKTVPINSVIAWGESFNKNPMSAISLPVVASAYGNSIMFSWEYQDNYSAGAKSEFTSNGKEGKEKVEGYFQMDVPYADYYGRMYYYNFDLSVDAPNDDSSDDNGFYMCHNLINCHVELISGGNAEQGYACGFVECHNLIDCSADITAYTEGIGFLDCKYLTKCTCDIKLHESCEISNSICFYSCSYINDCSGIYSAKGYGNNAIFYNCTYLTNCIGYLDDLLLQDIYSDESCSVFRECKYLVNCNAEATFNERGFYVVYYQDCSYCSNCSGLQAELTYMWSGACNYVDDGSCDMW